MGKQTKIPGTDGDRHSDLDKQAEKYVEARDVRMQCSAAETIEKEALHVMMNKYGLTEYRIIDADPNLLVTIEVVEETVKVKKIEISSPKTKGKGEPDGEAEPEATVTE